MSTSVVAVAELLPGTGSSVVELTLAVFESTADPDVDGSTFARIFTVFDPPAAIVPNEVEPVHAPPALGSQAAPSQNVSPVNSTGSVSLDGTPAASDGPAFETTMV